MAIEAMDKIFKTICAMEEDVAAIRRWGSALIPLDRPLHHTVFEIGREIERMVEAISERRDALYIRLGPTKEQAA
jgi:hypothetical protein